MTQIVTRLKEVREARGLTQKELADKVEIRRETIVRLEKNQYNPSLIIALKIAQVFECKVEDLFKISE